MSDWLGLTDKATAGDTGTFNLIHGAGAMLGEASGLGGTTMPWFIEKQEDEYCVIKGTREEPVETVKCHATEDEAKAHMAALYANEPEDEDSTEKTVETDTGNIDEPDRFFVYKAADGTMRWASVSSVAVKDKEFEVVTEKAYDDAIQHARDTGEYGELDLVHVPGTDVGDCDFMARAGKRLLEGGTWYDTPMALGAMKAVQDKPDYWGMSIKFVYDPSQFDGEQYHGNIRIRKRSILPQEMAASFGTKLVAMTGGDFMKDELSEKTRNALKELGVPEDEIEALAEKQKAVEPEPNVVEKEAETETPPEMATVEVKKASVWERLKDSLSNLFVESDDEPDAETGGVENQEEVTETPVEVQEKAVAPTTEVYTALAQAISAPLIEQMRAMQVEHATRMEAVEKRLAEAEEAVETKVLNRLAEIPQVVKVRASSVEATVAEPEKPRGPVLPQAAPENDNYVQNLIADVTQAVAGAITNAQPKATI